MQGLLLKILLFCCALLLSSNILAEDKWLAPEVIAGAETVDAAGVLDLAERYVDLVVIDSRKITDYENGHIEGAINLPDTDTSSVSLDKVLENKRTTVVFYCNGINCKRSSIAVSIALESGFSSVFWYRKGWDEWTQLKFPIVVGK